MKCQLILLFLLGLKSLAFSKITTVNGTIKDNTGIPSLGVHIPLKNTQIGTGSNENGQFEITYLEEGGHLPPISYLGFRTRDIPFTIANEKVIDLGDFILYEDNDILAEVVVQGERIINFQERKQPIFPNFQ